MVGQLQDVDDDRFVAASAPSRSSSEGVDEIGDQRALARPGDAGDAPQHPLRYPDAEVAQVVGRRVLDAERVVEGAPSRRGVVTRSLRARDVAVSLRSRSSRRPLKTTSPPPSPARGPMLTIQSAARTTAGPCSTTSTELPWSRRRWSMAMR